MTHIAPPSVLECNSANSIYGMGLTTNPTPPHYVYCSQVYLRSDLKVEVTMSVGILSCCPMVASIFQSTCTIRKSIPGKWFWFSLSLFPCLDKWWRRHCAHSSGGVALVKWPTVTAWWSADLACCAASLVSTSKLLLMLLQWLLWFGWSLLYLFKLLFIFMMNRSDQCLECISELNIAD